MVAPHHEAAAGFMAEAASRITGKPAVCIGTLGPGIANLMPAIQCAKVENSPVIFLGGQRARVTEQRVRRGRIQFVTPGAAVRGFGEVSAPRSNMPTRPTRSSARRSAVAMSGTPGPSYIEYPSHVIQEELDVPEPLPPHRYRLINQGADGDRIAEAAKLIREAKNPILLVGHAVHTSRIGRSGQGTGRADELPGDPDLGRHVLHQGSRGPHLPVRAFPMPRSRRSRNRICVLALGTELGEPVHYGRWRHWMKNEANRKWIYVEQDPTAIGVNRPIDVPLVGDLRGVVPQLGRALARAARAGAGARASS